MNILFVCTGNTCRSPMAEELLRCMAKELQIDDLEVSSAGTDADAGLPASFGASMVIAERGGDLFNHAAVQLTADRAGDADLILTMTQAHRERVLQLCPEAAAKTYTLIGYATGTDHDIEDPFGGDSAVYEACASQLCLAVAACLMKLRPERAQRIRQLLDTQGME